MNIVVAIVSSCLAASAAILRGGKVIAEVFTDCARNHSETLMPMVAEVFERAGITPAETDYIACASGPGSFTGLRIGAATAKGLSMGANNAACVPIIPVPSLDALSYNIYQKPNETIVAPLTDARAGRAYTAFYRQGEKLERISDYMCEPIEIIAEKLKLTAGNVIFLGDGAAVYKDYLKSAMDCSFAQPHLNAIRASSVGALAAERIGESVMPADFKLLYVTQSSAKRIGER